MKKYVYILGALFVMMQQLQGMNMTDNSDGISAVVAPVIAAGIVLVGATALIVKCIYSPSKKKEVVQPSLSVPSHTPASSSDSDGQQATPLTKSQNLVSSILPLEDDDNPEHSVEGIS